MHSAFPYTFVKLTKTLHYYGRFHYHIYYKFDSDYKYDIIIIYHSNVIHIFRNLERTEDRSTDKSKKVELSSESKE